MKKSISVLNSRIKYLLVGSGLIIYTCQSTTPSSDPKTVFPAFMPTVAGNWWQVASNPDLGELTGSDQQPVDFGIWQAADSSWQIWSCIRKTREGGNTRLFHGWEGQNLTDTFWKPLGIVMRADTTFGEEQGGLQAPYVFRHEGVYWMFYGDWNRICLAKSMDGKYFERVLRNNSPALFGDPAETNTRDAMVIRTDKTWYCYYTAHPEMDGAVFVRTSEDMFNWSQSKKAAYGGLAGKGKFWYAECPFVVKYGDSFCLFRTQAYGRGIADSLTNNQQTSVYWSPDPVDFGVDDDKYLLGKLQVAAPEIFQYEGRWYIAALMPDLQGIRIARLAWEPKD
jgi:hypothetical protein